MSKKKEKPMQFFLPIGGGLVNQCYFVSEEELLEKDPAAEISALLERAVAGELSARTLSRRRDELLREAVRTDRAEALLCLMPQRRMDCERFAALFAFAESCESPDAAAWLLEYRHKHYLPAEFAALERRRMDREFGLAAPDETELRRIFRLRYVRQGVCVCGVKTAQRSYEIPAVIGGKPVVGVDAAAFYSLEPMPHVRREFKEDADEKRTAAEPIRLGRASEKRGLAEKPLCWRVLRREEGRTLLLCERSVAELPYHGEMLEVSWENCALRRWLNDVFLPLSFTPAEQERILTTAVKTPDNPNFGSSGGAMTEDRLFLLSAEEVSSLLADDTDRSLGSWWWLRSPGFDNSFAATVTPSGAVVRIGSFVDSDDYAVRPALWMRTD